MDLSSEGAFRKVDLKRARLVHPYLEYSQVPNTSLKSVSLMLITGSIVVGVASLLILAVQPKKAYQIQ